jgi:TRAP transporter TAXI family solute receptor
MKKSLILILFFCLALPLSADAEKMISIGTAPAGGAWYGLGGALADVITKNVEGVTAVAEVTGAAIENVKLLGTHKIDIGFTISVIGQSGYEGKPPFKEKYTNLRTLVSSIQTGFLQIVVLKNSGLKYVDDLKGKRVAVGPAGHGSLKQLQEIFGVLGFTFKDISPVYLPYEQSVTALGDRKVDAAVLYVAPPAPAIKEFSLTNDIDLLALKETSRETLVKKYGHYIPKTIRKGTYKGLDHDIQTVGTANIIMIDAGMDEALVYKITKAIFDNIEKFKAGHPSAKGFNLNDATKGSTVPFHPGAIKYFKEQGVWKD